MAIKSSLGLIVCIAALFYTTHTYAQNVRRIEEEVVKDKEREVKLQELIEQRRIEAEKIRQQPLTEEDLKNNNLVEVEPNNVLPSDLGNIYPLVPYRVRRSQTGHFFTFTYSQYNPVNYKTDYSNPGGEGFDSLYGAEPMLEVGYTFKWNFSLGSLGLDFGFGNYSNENSGDLGDASLKLQMIRVGAKYALDTLFDEPFIAPYAIGGAYTNLYKETQGGASYDGTTSAAPYFGFGLLMQLGWLDKSAATEAYTDSGVENTYAFIEMREYMASTTEQDPDLSTDLDMNFGLTLEF